MSATGLQSSLATITQRVKREINALVTDDEIVYYILEAVRHHAEDDQRFNNLSFQFKTTSGVAVYPLNTHQEPGYAVPDLRRVIGALWLTPSDGRGRKLPSISDEFKRWLDSLGGSLQTAAENSGLAGYDLQTEGIIIAPPPEETGAVVSGRGLVALPLPVGNWNGTAWDFYLDGEKLESLAHFESPWFTDDRAAAKVASYAAHLIHGQLLGNQSAAERALSSYAQTLAAEATAKARQKPAPQLRSIFD